MSEIQVLINGCFKCAYLWEVPTMLTFPFPLLSHDLPAHAVFPPHHFLGNRNFCRDLGSVPVTPHRQHAELGYLFPFAYKVMVSQLYQILSNYQNSQCDTSFHPPQYLIIHVYPCNLEVHLVSSSRLHSNSQQATASGNIHCLK